MKFNIYTLLFLLLTNTNYGQKNNIYVEYNLTLHDEIGFSNDQMFGETFRNASEEANRLIFGLIITTAGSKFYEENTGIQGGHEAVMAKVYGNYMGIIYNINDDVIKQSALLGTEIYTKEKKTQNWILTSETKQIDNYLCYKATNTYTVINPKGTFKFPVTAWYCPKLPYSYGPNGYGNLPGLILELQVRNVNYHSKKIILDTELTFDTKFLENATLLTEEELEKKLVEFDNLEEN